MKKIMMMAAMALFCIGVSAQCPDKKKKCDKPKTEQCCKKKKGDCCKKKAARKKATAARKNASLNVAIKNNGQPLQKKGGHLENQVPASFVSRLSPLRRLAVCACRTPAF